MKINKIAFFSMALAAASSAQAGDLLHMKAGEIVLQDSTAQYLAQPIGVSSADVRYFVVQFDGAVDAKTEAALSAIGLQALQYLPDDAFVVRGTVRDAGLAKTAIAGVKAISGYEPEWKISEEFRGFTVKSGKLEQLLVSALDTEALPRVVRELQQLSGVEIRNGSGRDLTVEAGPAQIPAIARIEGIEWIERLPYFVTWDFDGGPAASSRRPTDYVYTGHESGTKLMGFEVAWSRGYTGKGQMAAVADTGLDSGNIATIHPDFVGNIYKGFAIGLGGSSWGDSMGHGTHVSGSVVGNGKSSELHLRGGAHDAQLVMLGLWSDLLDNLAPGTDFDKLIGTAYKEGARIHSNSWGSPANLGAYDTMAARVDEYMWKHPDMLVLFAAGNSGIDEDKDGVIDLNSIGSPATAKNVLTVGASENELSTGGIQKKLKDLRDGDKHWGVEPLASDTISNHGNGMACFSSRGPTQDGRTKPEIVAPGTNIISTRSHNPKASPLWGEFDANYVYAGGTSMATPLTAGAATVTRQFLMEGRHLDAPSAALVKATMMHTATDLYPGQYGEGRGQEIPTHRPNNQEGYGRVDMDFATRIGDETQLIDEKTGVATAEDKTVTVAVRKGATLRATLTWTDAPAAAAAAKALVNDLDLKVVGPTGETKQLGDHVNNTEMLELANLPAGDYQVVVSGKNVPQGKSGKQPYALVIGQY